MIMGFDLALTKQSARSVQIWFCPAQVCNLMFIVNL